MRNFSSKRRENFRHNSRKQILVVLGVAGVLFLILLTGRTIVGSAVSFITNPAYILRDWFTDSGAALPSYFRARSELLAEVERLRAELAEQDGNNATIARLTFENEELKSLFITPPEEPRIVAHVISRPPFLPYDSVMIDRGTNDGIVEGAVVYQAKDQALGLVLRAYPESALVSLFSSSGIETTVFIVGPDIYTTAYGNGGGVVRVSVPQGIALEEGNVVLLPGLGGGVLGTIDSIRSEPTRPEQDGFVSGDVPLYSLHKVSVAARALSPISFDEARAAIQTKRESALKLDVPEGVLVETATSSATSTPTTTAPTNI